MLKLVSDNSGKYFDAILQEWVEDTPEEYPYYLENEDAEMVAMFKTFNDALQYQMGMGLRATTTIEIWDI